MISVGVDIGTFSIKIAEVEATSKSYAIRRIIEIPLSADLTKDPKIEVIDALRNLFAQLDLERTEFVFSLPQKWVSARLLHLPFKERFKVQKAIVSLLEDEIPLNLEDAVFDAKIVRFAGKGAEVLAMAAPRERVREVLDLSHDCGVEPALISTNALGLNNLFEKWADVPPDGLAPDEEIPAPKPAELVVNVGHVATQLLVISNGVLLGARTIDWGGKNMADAIASRYGLNYIQALRELQTKGFLILDKTQGTKEQVTFSQTLETSLQALVGDMRLKLLELESELRLTWTKGHLLGGGGQLKNLNGFLTQAFQIPFNRYKQFENHPPVTFEYSPHLEIVSGTAVGLALEGLRRPRNPATNFLKGDLAKKAQVFETVWEKWGTAAKIAGATFGIFLVYAIVRDSFASRLLDESERALKTQAQAVAGINARQASASKVRKFISAQEKLDKGRKQAEKVLKMTSALDVMEAISSAMPPKSALKLEVKYLTIRNTEVEIHGHTPTEFDRSTILKALQKVAVGGVDPITSKVTAPAGRVPFGFKFQVSRSGG